MEDAKVVVETPNALDSDSDNDTSIIPAIPPKITDLPTSIGWFDFIMILIFNLVGYLSFLIPGLDKIQETQTRVAAAGIVVIIIFATMDGGSAIKLVIEFILSTKIYDYILKMLKKTPKVIIPVVETA